MGALFIVTGLAGMGFGAYLMLEPGLGPKTQAAEDALATQAVSLCRQRAEDMGLTIDIKGSTANKLSVHAFGSVDEYQRLFNQSNLLMTGCPSLRLNAFCFGESCQAAEDEPIMRIELLPKTKILVATEQELK